jgi:starch synthase (maltosyl-transferring)
VALKQHLARGHVVIERIWPRIDCGLYRAKAVVGDEVEVTADIFRDGPTLLQAALRYRGPADRRWQETSMTMVDNDRWSGSFTPTTIGTYRYAIEAWPDHFGTWRRDLVKRIDAGQAAVTEIEEGAMLLEERLPRVPAMQRKVLMDALAAMRAEDEEGRLAAALDYRIATIMSRYPDKAGSTTSRPALELTVDRERARFGAWYEFFPRSTGTKTKHGTLKTAAKRLAQIADMGFDVVYLPPIHPIGKTHRKGRNNALGASPNDIGSPWAIGGEEGGHTAIHPELGTLDDFDAFVAEAHRVGLEVCLDYAIQCSPDHPWVTEHPEWFHHRPDGSIKYAENPPKKYQDIYPINFDTPDRAGLWEELKGVLDHWISHGVKIFRVDNPHTKSFAFWDWCINSLKQEFPDLILLAEAFTRPKVMQHLAKLGFTQSYTYFTWRNSKWELTEYMTELTRTEAADYFRPNFFANTPDILHEYLQVGGPSAFKIRLVLAAMLSPTYGIYSGYELFENVPVHEGSEEYLNSEKYELRPRDFSESGSLIPYITKINEIRRKHSALSTLTNLHFHHADKDSIIAFSKRSSDGDAILVVVNLNPFHWEEATLTVDLAAVGIEDPARPYEVHDLLDESTFLWHGPWNYVRLDPDEPAHVFQVRR